MANPRRLSTLLLLLVVLIGCTPTPAANAPIAPATVPMATNIVATVTVDRTRTSPPVTETQRSATATKRPATKRPATIAPTAVPPTIAALNCNRTLRGGTTSALPKLTLATLVRCRPEVSSTLRDIKRNGPFAFSRDNITFENRERLLPRADRGAYREYTVITPAESDRGARRLVTSGGRNREPADYQTLYYTDDHYDSFWIVVER